MEDGEDGEELMKTLKNLTLEGWDVENVGGDIQALQQHFIFGLLVVILIELGVFKICASLTGPSLNKVN